MLLRDCNCVTAKLRDRTTKPSRFIKDTHGICVCNLFEWSRSSGFVRDGALVRDCRLVYHLHLVALNHCSMLFSPNKLVFGQCLCDHDVWCWSFSGPHNGGATICLGQRERGYQVVYPRLCCRNNGVRVSHALIGKVKSLHRPRSVQPCCKRRPFSTSWR
jgi:hypothetical protein